MLPPNVVYGIAKLVARQACPMHDARRDVAALNCAFGARGEWRLEPGPRAELSDSRYMRREARELLACPHVTGAEAESQLSRLRGVGRNKRGREWLDGAAVRRLVYRAHGDDSARWLACCVRRTTGAEVPPWFADMWLPLCGCRRADDARRAYGLISGVWRDVLEAAACLGVDAASEQVRQEIRRYMLDHQTRALAQARTCATDWIVERLGSASAMRARASRAVAAENLGAALAALDAGLFGVGSGRRAAELPRTLWVPSALLDACVRFVLEGAPGSLDDVAQRMQLLSPEMVASAARELAAARGLLAHVHVVALYIRDPRATISDVDGVKGAVDHFDHFGLVPHFCGYDVDVVADTVTGATSEDLPMFEGDRRSERLDIMDASRLRECFDRRRRLADGLVARGLELRHDSRLCNAYIVRGEYAGPRVPSVDDAAEMVVEMMAEMDFLFRATRYARMKLLFEDSREDAAADSEAAKHAAVHEFLVNGGPEEGLPLRLRALAEDRRSLEEAWEEYKEYEEVSDNGGYFSSDESDSDSYSDEDRW